MSSIPAERLSPPEPLPVEPVRWIGGPEGYLQILDQTRLPGDVVYLECRDVTAIWDAIRNLRVRGAPAIGIAAAYGVCLGLGGRPPPPPSFLTAWSGTPNTWRLPGLQPSICSGLSTECGSGPKP